MASTLRRATMSLLSPETTSSTLPAASAVRSRSARVRTPSRWSCSPIEPTLSESRTAVHATARQRSPVAPRGRRPHSCPQRSLPPDAAAAPAVPHVSPSGPTGARRCTRDGSPTIVDWKRRCSSSCHCSERPPGRTIRHRSRSPRTISCSLSSSAMMVLPAPGSSASRKRNGWRGSVSS